MLKRLLRSCVSPTVWEALVRWRVNARLTWKQCRNVLSGLGVRPTLNLWVGEQLGPPCSGLRRLQLDGFDYPLYYRPRSSDLSVICQVFGQRDYEGSAGERDVRLILDCGANIGCTSFYLLHRYPNAHVIAVEPDPGNFRVCQRNLAPFGDRVTLVNAGVWSSEGPLRVVRGAFRDKREWSFQVRPALPGEPADCLATTIEALLVRSGRPFIDLLKMDIEGAEEELFTAAPDGWLRRTRHLAIELHGPSCERAFWRALAGYRCSLDHSGELLICRDLRRVVDPA
jgi:FkbM family methyltransferase